MSVGLVRHPNVSAQGAAVGVQVQAVHAIDDGHARGRQEAGVVVASACLPVRSDRGRQWRSRRNRSRSGSMPPRPRRGSRPACCRLGDTPSPGRYSLARPGGEGEVYHVAVVDPAVGGDVHHEQLHPGTGPSVGPAQILVKGLSGQVPVHRSPCTRRTRTGSVVGPSTAI